MHKTVNAIALQGFQHDKSKEYQHITKKITKLNISNRSLPVLAVAILLSAIRLEATLNEGHIGKRFIFFKHKK